ncbi:hypothetical protein ACKFKF_17925 [Phormidesmis sp. 146-12]
MKPIFANYLSAFLLSAATTAISLPAFSAPLPRTSIATAAQMLTSSTSNAPTVTSSAVVGNHHLIRVAVANHALKTLTISIPSQMEGFSNIQVTDQTGKAITSKISANKQQVVIAFDQAVTPGSALEIDFSGVPQITPWNQVLEYGVSAEQEGLAGQIPLGTARVQVPFSS